MAVFFTILIALGATVASHLANPVPVTEPELDYDYR